MDNQNMNNYYQPANTTNVIKCPGKEITGMIMGINSLLWGSLAFLFCWHIVISFIYGGIGIGFAIAAFVLHKQVMETATHITKKITVGKNLATAGMICSCVAIGLSIVVIVGLIACTALGSASGLLTELYF